MKDQIHNLIKQIVTIAVFAGLGFLLFKYRESLYVIKHISFLQFIFLSLLVIFSIILSGSKLSCIANQFDVRLKTSEWFALSSMTTILNTILFKSGSLATSAYLKKKYNFPYASFVGAFIGDQLIILFLTTFIGSIVSIFLIYSGIEKLITIFIIFSVILIFLLVILSGKLVLPKIKIDFIEQLKIGVSSFRNLFQNKMLLYTLLTQNLLLIIIAGLRLYTACSILQQEISIFHCLLFVATMTIIRIIPIAHTDIGVREITVGFVSKTIGSGLKAGILITSLDRMFELLLTGLCVGIFRKSLLKQKNPK